MKLIHENKTDSHIQLVNEDVLNYCNLLASLHNTHNGKIEKCKGHITQYRKCILQLTSFIANDTKYETDGHISVNQDVPTYILCAHHMKLIHQGE